MAFKGTLYPVLLTMQHISDTFWWLCDVTSVEEHLDFVFVRLLFESIEIDF